MAQSHPPSVHYACGPWRHLPAVSWAALLAVLACLLAWWWAQGMRGPQAAAALLLGGGCAAVLWQFWHTQVRGELQWDGREWTLQVGSRTVPLHAPQMRLDRQSACLLHAVRRAGGGVWLWCERRSDPARWDDLRRAVYSRAREGDFGAAADDRTR